MMDQSSEYMFSIILCTYNRADVLLTAIQSLLDQTIPAHKFEIVIVDNASTDSTSSSVEQLLNHTEEHHLKYVYEPKPGLGFARYTGLQAATGNWIGYLDDDAKASGTWLEEACRIVQSINPLDGFGGPIHPYYLAKKPNWFKDAYEMRSWGGQERYLDKKESFSGSNMFFKRELLLSIGTPLIGLGMVGTSMGFGEETLFFERAWQLNSHAYFHYSPDLLVYHAVPASKMNVRYILERMFMNGASNAKRRMPAGSLARFGYGLRNGLSAIRLLLIMIIKRFSYRIRQQWLVECGGPVAKKMGTATTAMGILVTFKQR